MTRKAKGRRSVPACCLCGARESAPVQGRVRDMPKLGIRRCLGCGLVFLESFDHIREGFYEHAYADSVSPGESWRHCLNRHRDDDLRRASMLEPMVLNKSFLDIGCGAGGLVLALRGRCARIAAVEPQARWKAVLSRKGFRVYNRLGPAPAGAFDVVGLFHVLEHIADPVPFLREAAAKTAPGGRLVIEVPNADDALLGLYGCKAFSEFAYWSPHLYLYNQSTLRALARKAGLAVDFVRHVQRYPLSNHLRWLARGKPGGHEHWAFLDSPALTDGYARLLGSLGITDTIVAGVRRDKSRSS